MARSPLHHYSKDKRPDLKQFLLSMLCVDHNIPIRAPRMAMPRIRRSITEYSPHPYIQPRTRPWGVCVCGICHTGKPKNNKIAFLTRLPATYSECGRVIQKAVAKPISELWQKRGLTRDRRQLESTVTLYDIPLPMTNDGRNG